ncbi:MAG: Bax inhibitor-1/YccA family membrane protein [archaeon]
MGRNTFMDLPFSDAGEMSIQGVVNKSGFLITLVVISAAYIWTQYFTDGILDPAVMPVALIGSIIAVVTALVTVFKKTWAAFTAPVYAITEGIVLGVVSSFFEQRYPGIVFHAVGLTFGTFTALLAAYTTRLIKPSENFKLGVMAATGGIALVYIVSMVLGIFGIEVPLIHESGIAGIAFSAFVVIIAALNLVLDFDFIEQGVKQGAPKYMEWYSAFGLLVTLIWLYFEILKLLSKARSK